MCEPAEPCASWLVCVDGLCREHVWPPGARGPAPERPRPIDLDAFLAVTHPDALTHGDLVHPAADAADAEAGETWDAPPRSLDAVADTLSPGDPGPDAPAVDPDALPPDALAGADGGDAAIDGGPSDASDAGPEDTGSTSTVVLLLGEDGADVDFGGTTIHLELGQGWATDLTVPLAGLVIGMEAVVLDPWAAASCALFRPAVWFADDTGTFPNAPWWASPDLQALQGDPAPQMFILPQKVPVPQGKVRVGLVLEGDCEGEPDRPVLASDTSGDLSRTWVYAPQPPAVAWVPGELLGVEGRWALRILLEVEWPGG